MLPFELFRSRYKINYDIIKLIWPRFSSYLVDGLLSLWGFPPRAQPENWNQRGWGSANPRPLGRSTVIIRKVQGRRACMQLRNFIFPCISSFGGLGLGGRGGRTCSTVLRASVVFNRREMTAPDINARPGTRTICPLEIIVERTLSQ